MRGEPTQVMCSGCGEPLEFYAPPEKHKEIGKCWYCRASINELYNRIMLVAHALGPYGAPTLNHFNISRLEAVEYSEKIWKEIKRRKD